MLTSIVAEDSWFLGHHWQLKPVLCGAPGRQRQAAATRAAIFFREAPAAISAQRSRRRWVGFIQPQEQPRPKFNEFLLAGFSEVAGAGSGGATEGAGVSVLAASPAGPPMNCMRIWRALW